MFRKLLRPKFERKCKTCVDCIKTRIEAIRRKKKAVQKFLKDDIADLLRNDLDYNAYGRAEMYLFEQNFSSCYELIAKFNACISDNLESLCKESNLPDKCKEATASLIYAAARFADLPELRELRTLFKEKFGDSLEPHISKEFVERLRFEPTKEMKIQMLHDIAQEFSILWDSKALEERLGRSFPLLHEKPAHESLDVKPAHKSLDVKPAHKSLDANPALKSLDVKPAHKSLDMKHISCEDSWKLQSSSDDEASTDLSGPKTSSSLGSVSEDDQEEYSKRPSHNMIIPQSYLKPKFDKYETKESNHDVHKPVVPEKPKPRSVRTRSVPKNPPVHCLMSDHSDSRDEEEKKMDKRQPRSVRTISVPKNPPVYCLASDSDSRDEEEKKMDELLMHYSNKNSPYESVGQNIHRKSDSGGQHIRGISAPPSLLPASVEPERLSEPKIPDYDDLAARLAAIKRR